MHIAIDALGLIMDCIMNSTFLMLRTKVSTRQTCHPLDSTLLRNDIGVELATNDWDLLAKVVPILKIFFNAIQKRSFFCI